jgi:hypothetical protein
VLTRESGASPWSEPLLSEEGMSPEQLTVRVAWVRGTMQVEDAALFDEDLRIMLVDPISEILRAYEGQAFEVKVVDMPTC